MPTKFDDYVRGVEEEAKADGPDALAQWDAFNAHFAMAREVRQLRKERHLTQERSPLSGESISPERCVPAATC